MGKAQAHYAELTARMRKLEHRARRLGHDSLKAYVLHLAQEDVTRDVADIAEILGVHRVTLNHWLRYMNVGRRVVFVDLNAQQPTDKAA